MAEPILHWLGGKRAYLPFLLDRLPKFSRYVEPFIGGGAMCFYLSPKKGIIADINKELINVYKCIKKNPRKVIGYLKEYTNDEKTYYEVRDACLDNMSNYELASRTIFLNKTCFCGLYRVNKEGKFNVTYGFRKNPTICDVRHILDLSRVLQNISIYYNTYENILPHLKKGDFVFLDPPYVPISNSSNFTSYTKQGFTWKDQEKLLDLLYEMDKNGVKFMLTNSDTKELNALYKDFKIEKVNTVRMISAKMTSKFNKVKDIVVTNYDIPNRRKLVFA